MSLTIQCPNAIDTVTPRLDSSGVWRVCVRGTHTSAGATHVRVLVVPRPGSGMSTADPAHANCVDAAVTGQAWCARDVAATSYAGAALDLVVYAWAYVLGGSGSGPVNPPDDAVNFHAAPAGSGMTGDNCCDGCGSGMKLPPPYEEAAAALTASAAVRVTVPDGPHAGHHTAGPVAHLTWRAVVGATVCDVKVCPTDGLVVRLDGRPVEAGGVRFGPMSAVIPGSDFGASGPVLVSQA